MKEEIRAEALVRNVTSFARFLEIAALNCGEIMNYQNIATECGVSAPAVKEYFTILDDTMLGFYLPAFTLKIKRRLVQAPKFYFFDVGIANYLLNRKNLKQGSLDFGKAFEHFMIQELKAYISYTSNENQLSYWRTASQFEVDCIIGNAKLAIEIKSSAEVQPAHCKGLKAFKEDHPGARLLVVSFDKRLRMMGDIEIYPAENFLSRLWKGEFF